MTIAQEVKTLLSKLGVAESAYTGGKDALLQSRQR